MKWQKKLANKGWLVPSWPEEYGGTNWTQTQRYIFSSECAKAGAPKFDTHGSGYDWSSFVGKRNKKSKKTTTFPGLSVVRIIGVRDTVNPELAQILQLVFNVKQKE